MPFLRDVFVSLNGNHMSMFLAAGSGLVLSATSAVLISLEAVVVFVVGRMVIGTGMAVITVTASLF